MVLQDIKNKLGHSCDVEGCDRMAFLENKKCYKHYLFYKRRDTDFSYKTKKAPYAKDLSELK